LKSFVTGSVFNKISFRSGQDIGEAQILQGSANPDTLRYRGFVRLAKYPNRCAIWVF